MSPKMKRRTLVALVVYSIVLCLYCIGGNFPRLAQSTVLNKQDKANHGLNKSTIWCQLECQAPCTDDDRPNLLPMIFMRNTTSDLLDPVNGPLASISNSNCPLCACSVADIIMTFVDDGYLDTLSIWLHYYRPLDHSHRILCLFALSESSFHKVERLISDNQDNFREDFGQIVVVQANTHSSKKTKKLETLWAYRMRTLSQFLHTFPSLNLIFTDLDAVWLRDPQPLLAPSSPTQIQTQTQSNNTSSMAMSIDIVASQATFPPECAILKQSKQKHQIEDIGADGGTAVFGFIYFLNTPATRRIAADLAKKASSQTTFDDQRALNCHLYQDYDLSASELFSDGSFLLHYNSTTTDIKHNNNNDEMTPSLSLRLLTGSQVVRHCDKYRKILHQSATVAHCGSQKTGKSKMKMFHAADLLPSDLRMYDWERSTTTTEHKELNVDADVVKKTTIGDEVGHQDIVTFFNDSKTAAFNFALQRFHNRSSSTFAKTAPNLYYLLLNSSHEPEPDPHTWVLNSVRVPKAGSSSLSIIARALAGCLPDGYPACKYPGDPPGSCPLGGLLCPRVKGQVNHKPNYDEKNGRRLPTITSLRDPTRRLLSAFFYTFPHRPKPVSDHQWTTFVQHYLEMPRYRNVMTKMLSGSYAYDSFNETIHTIEKAKARLCNVDWFYIVGMETSGQLLLYETSPFDQIKPNPVAFDLPAEVVANNNVNHKRRLEKESKSSKYIVPIDPTGKRHNDNSEYVTFRKTTFVENDGDTLIHRHNGADFEVYEFSLKLFCARLGRSGILEAVSTAEDTKSGTYQSLKETIKEEINYFCPGEATAQPVGLYCS